MFVADRVSLLAAAESLLPLAPAGAVAHVAADEADGRLTVTVGQDGRGARSIALGRVLVSGAVALPLAPLVRALRCGTGHSKVEVASNATTCAVMLDPDGVGRKFVFETGEPDEAPEWPSPPSGALAAVLPATEFARLVSRVEFAAAQKSPFARGWTTACVQLGIGPDGVSAAATDGLLLATATVAAEVVGSEDRCEVLVPADIVRAWVKVAKHAESARLVLADGLALFEAGVVAAWAEPESAGQFPRWRDVRELPNTLTVATERFRTELEAAVAVADAKEPRVTLAAKPGALTLSATTGKARATMTVPVPGFSGPAVQIPLDARRLLRVVDAYSDAPALALSYGPGVGPLVIGGVPGCSCVLVPSVERSERRAG